MPEMSKSSFRRALLDASAPSNFWYETPRDFKIVSHSAADQLLGGQETALSSVELVSVVDMGALDALGAGAERAAEELGFDDPKPAARLPPSCSASKRSQSPQNVALEPLTTKN